VSPNKSCPVNIGKLITFPIREEYATRLAKEIKARYGLSSLVCDPQE
jgi:hypothetical protein